MPDIPMTDRTWNLLWQCFVCQNWFKNTRETKLFLVMRLVGIRVMGQQGSPQVAPSACCEDCYKKLDLSDDRPPQIHIPQTNVGLSAAEIKKGEK